MTQLKQMCTETLDKGADTLKSIDVLNEFTTIVKGRQSGDLELTHQGMETAMVGLASELADGDLEMAREELRKRGLNDIL